MLSVGPGKETLPIELSVALLIAVTELFDALKTRVNFLFGDSAISPGVLPA